MELLVVIGVIAVVIAILLPTISKARQAAARTVCMSNLHQIGIGIISYSNDNHGYWPRYIDFEPLPPGGDQGSYTVAQVWDNQESADKSLYSWNGLGRAYQYVRNQRTYFCPNAQDDSLTYERDYDWNHPPAGTAIFCSYCLRGWNQSYSDNNTGGSPGKKLSGVWNRALVSCWFMYAPTSGRPILALHKELRYPVLFGQGDVQLGQLPKRLDVNNPPDIWDDTRWQWSTFDSFDHARSGGRID